MNHFKSFIDFLSESKKKEDELNEGEGGGAAAGGDAGGAAGGDASGTASGESSAGDAAYMIGGKAITTSEDVLGKFDPSKGCMGKKDFHVPKMVGKLQHRWPCCNGGSKRKKDKNGKDKKYYHEKGMKVITSYADLTEDQKQEVKPVLVYNIPFDKVPEILDNTTIENPRYDRSQFTKYLNGSDERDLEVVGLFAEFPKECLAMAILAFDSAKADDCYICEIQSFKKGYGKELILKLLKYQKNLWLMSNVEAGDSLLDFYKDPDFKFKEHVVPRSVYDCPAHFFYTTDCDKEKLLSYIDQYYSQDGKINESKNKLTAHPKVIQQKKITLKTKTVEKASKIVAAKATATKEKEQRIKQSKLAKPANKKVIANQLRSKESKMQSKHTISQKEMKDFKQPKISVKKISFPKEEVEQLKKQELIVTTRVADDYDKFQLGDIVVAPWGYQYKVVSRLNIGSIFEHPWKQCLTDKQVDQLNVYDKISVLSLALQKKSSKMNESNYFVQMRNKDDKDLANGIELNKLLRAAIPVKLRDYLAFDVHTFDEIEAIFRLKENNIFTRSNKWYLVATMSQRFCKLAKQKAYAIQKPSKADELKRQEIVKLANMAFNELSSYATISLVDGKCIDVSNECRPSYASQSSRYATTFKSFGIGQEMFLFQAEIQFNDSAAVEKSK